MIKVNVVSGFLGAGKTTLIKHLATALTENNEKVVILENEFGTVGIDGKLLELEGLSVYEISSGCICCTLKNDFMSTLLHIANNICPDRILIEPSGIFVLSELYDIFKSPQVNSRLTLCSALTVIDCIRFLRHRNQYGFFFENQISYADTLVLSKTKDISEAELIIIIEALQSINPRAVIYSDEWAEMCKLDFLSLLSSQKHFSSHNQQKASTINIKDKPSHPRHGNHNFTAFGFVVPFKLTIAQLEEKLSDFITGSFGTLLRAKGHVNGDNGMLEFNYVDGTYEVKQLSHEIEPSVCFIGESLDKPRIAELFLR